MAVRLLAPGQGTNNIRAVSSAENTALEDRILTEP
jgi:hypothetical protein